eukprot:m51a1_g10634 hypothetical protein (296) ;mRNA; r:70959-72451
MAVHIRVLRGALPKGTDLHSVLAVLHELARDPAAQALPSPPLSARPWFSAPAITAHTARALCDLFGCPPISFARSKTSRKKRQWLHLWRHRDLWRSLLPFELDLELRATQLQEASLCLALGMHPRVGVASPVQLLSPLFAREFVCSFLAPPAAFVALCRSEAVVTERIHPSGITDPASLHLVSRAAAGGVVIADSLSEVAQLTRTLCDRGKQAGSRATRVDPLTLEVSGVPMAPIYEDPGNGPTRNMCFTADGSYSFMMELREGGHVWLVCHDVRIGSVVHAWRLCQTTSATGAQ